VYTRVGNETALGSLENLRDSCNPCGEAEALGL